MSRNKEIYFMALGGGQEVGASCYFLKIGNEAFLLDCGTGKKKGFSFGPAFKELEASCLIKSKTEIKNVFVSHAHIDHVGFLPTLMKEMPDTVFYMTETTKELSRFQLEDNSFQKREAEVSEKLAFRYMFDKIRIVSFMEEFHIGDVKVSIFPAGHIPGAMMILFTWKGKNILYTGDYSSSSTVLTDRYYLPDKLKIDYLITCALHAKNEVSSKTTAPANLVRKTATIIRSGESAFCVTRQISKGIEFLKMLTDSIERGDFPKVPVYIAPSVYSIVKRMENLSIPLIKDNVFPFLPDEVIRPHVIIASNGDLYSNALYKKVEVDFSIHDDFEETVHFIKKINPEIAVLVHCSPQTKKDSAITVEQVLMWDAECRTQFIFAENEVIHRIY